MLLNTWSELGCPVITQLPGEPPMNDRGPELEGFLCLVGGAVTAGTDLYRGSVNVGAECHGHTHVPVLLPL